MAARTSLPNTNGHPLSRHSQPAFDNLLPPTYKRLIASWLEEDCPTFDHGGYVVGDDPATAHLWCKSPGVVAGVPFFNEVFHQLGCQVVWHVAEGEFVDPSASDSTAKLSSQSSVLQGETSRETKTGKGQGKSHVATVTGPTNSLLLGERTALNILARCSGIATASARLLALVRSTGYTGILAGTRKTTPGFRLVEKYGMLVGGCDTHRLDLSGMAMLKDNHVAACRHPIPASNPASSSTKSDGVRAGGIQAAVSQARRSAGFSTKVEVEVSDEREAEEAIEAGADVVMLDNFPLAPTSTSTTTSNTTDASGGGGGDYDGTVGAVSRRLKTKYRNQKHFLIEVSGGITEGNVVEYLRGCDAATNTPASGDGTGNGSAGDDGGGGGVDIVSTSAIHQGVKHVDFSLKIV